MGLIDLLKSTASLLRNGTQSSPSVYTLPAASAEKLRVSKEIALQKAKENRTRIVLNADSEAELEALVDQIVENTKLSKGTLKKSPCTDNERMDHYISSIYHVVEGKETRAGRSRFHDSRAMIETTGYADLNDITKPMLGYAREHSLVAR
ncbi:MAG TPA: hypothetical protein VJI97_01390 [Candidatus Nanoarchaeia archaeon]|nr:hypothetical protein [Candidatus Nanoarchaeia archaeon]